VLSSRHPLAYVEEIALDALADEFLLFPRHIAPRLHDFYVNLCRSAGFEPKRGNESSRTRLTIGTWEASTTALLPQSVATHLPDGVVAIPISAPADLLETQLVWRTDDESPIVVAFLEVSGNVFAESFREA
jgi:DNA-binding transcriptional LysR family regulator